eukprot:7943245-Pyramimonas_sp.AAC.1
MAPVAVRSNRAWRKWRRWPSDRTVHGDNGAGGRQIEPCMATMAPAAVRSNRGWQRRRSRGEEMTRTQRSALVYVVRAFGVRAGATHARARGLRSAAGRTQPRPSFVYVPVCSIV